MMQNTQIEPPRSNKRTACGSTAGGYIKIDYRCGSRLFVAVRPIAANLPHAGVVIDSLAEHCGLVASGAGRFTAPFDVWSSRFHDCMLHLAAPNADAKLVQDEPGALPC